MVVLLGSKVASIIKEILLQVKDTKCYDTKMSGMV